ncbi:MAG: phasin family protein [Lysobacteraceae bacterium]|nr:MAG: phasin family protein [Xanthomonadaceae bacterium]
MYPFPQSVSPAVRSHVDANTAFLNELSQTMSRSFQQICQLNMQLGQTLLEEATSTTQRMLSTAQPTEALSAAASCAQPAADKLRAYQQQLSHLAATTQVDLTRVTEHHVQETSRTARALAEDVTRATAEQTNTSLRQQEEAIKQSREAFKREAERGAWLGAQYQGNLQSSTEGADGKPGAQAGSKAPSPPR